MTALVYQQRLFSSLRIGETVTVSRADQEELHVHSRQGDWDGACGLHCCVMALILLGHLSRVSNLADRKYGLAGALWKAGKENYFTGMSAYELAALLEGLEAPLQVAAHTGRNRQLLTKIQSCLDEGRLPIIGWDSKNGLSGHWVLAVGLEGTVQNGRFETETILCLDPKEVAPTSCGYNGRLVLRGPPPPSLGKSFVRYKANSGQVRAVTVTEIVSVGNAY